ncbi:triose-phosphate isomerase [Geothrix sp. SG200]|uniref:triose-phosphate isomerase n=1 Tax=Geothrix sp. SG200 TaxID=2922865 RepID=UPI001FADCCE6|nr:triose-phosphate isomerase [Geothrix sp. SG200]
MRFVVANWKMNFLSNQARNFCEAFLADYAPSPSVTAAIAPPFHLLRPVADSLRSRQVRVFGQNGHAEPKGAYTGEISMAQLQDCGCSGVILGHSERRQLFGETDEALVAKVKAARDWNLLPLLCVGETLEERKQGRTLEVLGRQLSILAKTGPTPLWVAYEPVWAIGTGLRAEVGQIRQAHGFINTKIAEHMSLNFGPVPILYGGSITPENFPELLEIPEVAGGLVGGASLDPAKFGALVKQAG